MKRNGLVPVPRELPPQKRVILYPTQDSVNQQQQQQNGIHTRARTALVTNNHNETIQQSNNNIRLSQQPPLSSLPNGTTKSTERSDANGTVPNGSAQPTSLNGVQKIQNPYYANPFFRPKVVPNQPQQTTNTNQQLPSRDTSSITATNVNIQTLTPSSTIIPNRGRQLIFPKDQNSHVLTNGRIQDSEQTVNPSSTQDDNRRWAHSVASASIVRRATSDERPNGVLKPPEINITNPVNNDALKQKGASATDIVISLMDTWRAPINPGSSSAVNILTRIGGIRDDSTLPGQISASGEQLPGTAPTSNNNNNQNWKKALVANFQKNSRNNPTAKIFNSKQTTIPTQPIPSINSSTTLNQQSKSERSMIFNGNNNERTFQASENTPTIPSLIRKSTEIIRITKSDNNNTVERSTSLQIQPTIYSNSITTITNKTEEIIKTTESTNADNVSQIPISIPATLITPKPPPNVEQQRAIITRVMIRRDFVKSTESRPPMPSAANIRSFIPPHSAKPGGLPTNNVIQVATITENNNNNNNTNPNLNPNRPLPIQQQQQQSMPLSQKSLLAFTSNNPIIREPIKIENNQQQSNGGFNDAMTSSSIMKMQQSQTMTNNSGTFRSNSLSAANAELRRKKDEINIKAKKRAISASAVPNDG